MLTWAIVAARILQFASLSVLFGSSLFYLYGLEGGPVSEPARRWGWQNLTLLIASVAAILATVGWLMSETVLLTDEAANAWNPSALWFVLWETGFGRVYLLRLVLLAVSVAVLLVTFPGRALWLTQAILGGIVAASFAWSGHGRYDDGLAGIIHTGGDALHALAAAIWIGALAALATLIVRSQRSQLGADGQAAYVGLERFSGIGLAVVFVIVLTGLINSWFLVGLLHWQALFTTLYGLSLTVKLVFFGLMLALAAANRFVLSPQLGLMVGDRTAADNVDPLWLAQGIRSLKISVITETVLAVFVLAAVSFFGTLEPPIAG